MKLKNVITIDVPKKLVNKKCVQSLVRIILRSPILMNYNLNLKVTEFMSHLTFEAKLTTNEREYKAVIGVHIGNNSSYGIYTDNEAFDRDYIEKAFGQLPYNLFEKLI